MTDTITVTGNIATDPEHKRTPAGVVITTFRVASGQRRFDRTTSAWVDSGTNWYTVSTFRGLAEHAFRSLRKGDRVILTGRLRLREWDTGTKKGVTAEIDAESIGHDLLFGTTTFERRSGSASPTTAALDVREGTPEDGTEGWAVPGSLAPPELVGVGSVGGDQPATGETPF